MKNIELNPKELLIALLHHWKMILALGLVFALALGGYSYYQQSKGIGELQQRYESEMAAYRNTIAAKQDGIAQNTAIAEAAAKFNEESLLMAVDPFNKKTAGMAISVEVAPTTTQLNFSGGSSVSLANSNTEQVVNLVNRYLVLAKNANLNELFKDILVGKHPENYLREIVNVGRFKEDSAGLVANDILTLSVIDTPYLDAAKALEKLLNYLQDNKPMLQQTIAAHELTVMNEGLVTSVDNGLAGIQAEQRGRVVTASAQITTLQKEIDKMKDNRPKAPSLVTFTIRNVIFGLLLGLLLGIVLAAVRYLSTFTLQYALQAQDQLDIGFLGGVEPRRRHFLTGLKNKLAADRVLKPEAEALQVAGTNIGLLAGGHRSILLTGQLDEDELAKAAAAIAAQTGKEGLRLVSGADLGNNARTAQLFSQADAVVLVERLQHSRLKQLLRDKEWIEQSKKPLLGYVIL